MPILKQYGTPHSGFVSHSGRYKWGSGNDIFGGRKDLKNIIEIRKLQAAGLTVGEIGRKLGITSIEVNLQKSIAKQLERETLVASYNDLMKTGNLSDSEIATKLAISNTTLNKLKAGTMVVEKISSENLKNALRERIDDAGYIDIGKGSEYQLGVSAGRLRTVVKQLEAEGYTVHNDIYAEQIEKSTKNNKQYTTVKVISNEPNRDVVIANKDKIQTINKMNVDSINYEGMRTPIAIDNKRIKIVYAEEGGLDRDGTIGLRRNAKDLDMGENHYTQARIATDNGLYLKGVALYDDNIPKGYDIAFYTNKPKGTPMEKVLKPLKDDKENPFGATISKQIFDGSNQSVVNAVNVEGDWDKWTARFSSQFLSKQTEPLIRERISVTVKSLDKDLDDIMRIDNPVVKQKALEDYKNGLGSKASELAMKATTGTKVKVLIPDPDMPEGQIYAPDRPNGERVVLVRHPHGGTFEIPELVVNNKNPRMIKQLGNAIDAVGIHPKTAVQLSGADFDGDTVLLIPNPKGKIKATRSIKELTNFDPGRYKDEDTLKLQYDTYLKKTTRDIERYDKALKTNDKAYLAKHPTKPQQKGYEEYLEDGKQRAMGPISNLISDMTLLGADQGEVVRAVKHSMVVIDSSKHKLNRDKSAEDNAIAAIYKKYQMDVKDNGKRGGSTIISRAKSKMDQVDDAMELVSKAKHPVEIAYAEYANHIKAQEKKVQKLIDDISAPKRVNKVAKDLYSEEVKSLNKKLTDAISVAPNERQARLKSEVTFREKYKDDMSPDKSRKLYAKIISNARSQLTSSEQRAKLRINITQDEWDAIDAGAISAKTLRDILRFTDNATIRDLATPKPTKKLPNIGRVKALLAAGKTYSEIADAVGVSVTTIKNIEKGV